MNKFFPRLLYFVAITGILFGCLDFIITSGLRHRTDYQHEIWNDVFSPEFKYDFVLLGSCQALYDYDPLILDSVLRCDSYILAMSNQTMSSHFFMWEMLKKQERELPKRIVLSLDYGDLTNRKVKGTPENEQFLSLAYDRTARKFMSEYGGFNYADLYLPCYRYLGHGKLIKYGLTNYLGINKYAGTAEHFKGSIGLNKEYSFHKEWYDEINYVQIDSALINMLENFISDCKIMGIELYLIIAPLGQELKAILGNEKHVYDIYKQLADKYDVDFIDNSYFLSNDKSFMESPNHLNIEGRTMYSRLVAYQIDSIVNTKQK